MSHLITIATCTLNQWSMDFDGNARRIENSMSMSLHAGARYRLGPELEVSGYGCGDHFLEQDTILHSWQVLRRLLQHDASQHMVCDVGMPVMHKGVRYNCRVIFLRGRILLIRPKMQLAQDGNYREGRWFTPWMQARHVEPFYLPRMIESITGQHTVPFGDGVLAMKDTCVGIESCEELFAPNSPHIHMGLDGVEIFVNGSASHHELRKLDERLRLIRDASRKTGGVYVYANLRGCDGERLYYDGSSLVVMNGDVYAQGAQFALDEVEIVTATLDIEDVRSYRGRQRSSSMQAASAPSYPRIDVDFALSVGPEDQYDSNINYCSQTANQIMEPLTHSPAMEIHLAPACWLWDYIRRCGASGFFLPLSGGIDSSATACIVASMCRLICRAIADGNTLVAMEVNDLFNGGKQDPVYSPKNERDLVGRVLHTVYMGSTNSSSETRARARSLADNIGAYHLDIDIDSIVASFLTVFTAAAGRGMPRFSVHGGEMRENLALQNVQARSRMVLSYLFAQLLPWSRNRSGGLLVLASANVDEALRGYLTKYDCSSGDLNPIGGISKTDLRMFIRHCIDELSLPSLVDILKAPPTAELEPRVENYTQTDEEDMGMSYEELSIFGRLRKISRCGPLSMYGKLRQLWAGSHSPRAVADRVKAFFRHHSMNRHKMTTLTPSLHAESYAPDDNRFDLRPFLYNIRWPWQFKAIDDAVDSEERRGTKRRGTQQNITDVNSSNNKRARFMT